MINKYKITSFFLIAFLIVSNISFISLAKTDAPKAPDMSFDDLSENDDSINEKDLQDEDLSLSSDPTSLDEVKEIIKLDPENEDNYRLAGEFFEQNGEKGTKIFLDGEVINFANYNNVQPVVESGRTLVPIRALSEGLGANVGWDEAKNLVTITIDNKIIELTIDSNIAVIDGKNVEMDVPAKTINGRTVIPLRFVSENLGKKVTWIDYSKNLGIISITE